jgi:hypothetical protein
MESANDTGGWHHCNIVNVEGLRSFGEHLQVLSHGRYSSETALDCGICSVGTLILKRSKLTGQLQLRSFDVVSRDRVKNYNGD